MKKLAKEPMGSKPLLLRVPAELRMRLEHEANRAKSTLQETILIIVGAHYGVDSPAPKRGRPPKSGQT